MSDVDKRVVQMDFDNKKFEKNVKKSTESLNTLKASLNFDGVSNSIDQVTVKINRMEYVAATAITNITNRVVNFGIQMVKSLSIDNISAGWAKFGQKTISIATLMAQTLKVNGKELTDTAERLATVNGLMDKLVWFSDETSYSFTDMVDNAGKFIAAGLDLDVSVKAMEGIATWAAISGQNASTASRAMYQLSQAMGKGKIQLIDWKSIQTANMDTAQFRENVLEAAVAMGQLTKEGDKFVTKTGKKFTQSQFTEQLSSGWFTSDVLTKTLEKYSSAADEIYELAKKEGAPASEIIEEYGDTLDEFGVKAFKAAQEARTLSDALNSVKDAVASKWMTTSELIFGDKDEAVELWTDLANELYEVFAEAGNFRNEILKVWKSLEGRKDLFQKDGSDQGAFWNIYDAIVALKKVIKDAWNTIFPISQMEDESDQAQEIGNGIKVLTSRFKEFTKTLKLSEVNSLRVKKVFEGLFSILKGLITLVKAARFIIDPIIDLLKQLVTAVLDKLIMLSGKIQINGEALLKISDKIHDSLVKLFEETIDFSGIFATLSKIIKSFIKVINSLFKKISAFIKQSAIFEKIKKVGSDTIKIVSKIFTDLNNALKSFGKTLSSLFNKIADFFKKAQLLEKVKTIFANLGNQIKKLSPLVEKIKGYFIDLGKKIESTVNTIVNSIKSLIEKTNVKSITKKIVKPMNAAMRGLKESIQSVGDDASNGKNISFFSAMKELFSSIYDLLVGILSFTTAIVLLVSKIIKAIGKILTSLGDGLVSLINGNIKLEGWQKSLLLTAGIIATIATLVAIIGRMAYNVFYTVLSIIKPFGVIADSISGLIDKIGLQFMTNFVKAIADAIVKISVSLLIIASIDEKKLWPAVGVVTAITAIMAALVAGMIFALKKMNEVQQTTALALIPMQQTKSNVGQLVDSVKGLINEAKKLLAANAIAMILNSFGAAMIQVALALFIMSKIDPEKMADGVGVIVLVSAIIGVLSHFASKSANGIKNTGFIVLELLALSSVIKSIAKILNTFKNITPEQLKNLAVIFGGLIVFLVACLLFLTKINDIAKEVDDIKTSKKLIKELSVLAASMLSFAVSVKILSTIPWNTLGVTLGIVGGFFVEFGLLMWALNAMSKKYSDFNSKDVVWKEMLSISSLLFSFAVSVAILSSISWNTLGVTMGIIGGFLIEVLAFLKILNLTVNKNPDVIDKVAKTVKPDRTVETLKALSGLLISFATSIKILSTISWDTLGVTLGIVGGFLAELAGFVALINLASLIGVGDTLKLDKVLKSLSAVILSIAITFKILETIPWDTLGVTLGIIGGVFVVLGGLVIAIGYAAKLASGAMVQLSTIGAFVALLAAITISLKVLSGIDIGSVLASAGAIAMVIAVFVAMMLLLTKVKDVVNNIGPVALGFLTFSVGIIAIGGALALVAKQPWNQILASAGAIGMVIASFAGMIMLLTKVKGAVNNIGTIVLGFLTFSAGILVIGGILTLVATQPWNQILAAAGAISMVIGAFAGMIVLLTKVKGAVNNIGPVVLGFLAFSVGIMAIGGALSLVAKQPWDQILAAAGAISIVIVALTGMLAVMKLLDISGLEAFEKMIGMSAGVIAFSGAMVILSMALQQFDSVEWESIAKAFVSVAGAIGVLALAAVLCKKIIPAILSLGAAFLTIGLGMMFSALSIQILIKTISDLGSMSSQSIENVKEGLSRLVSLISESLSPLITSFLTVIRDNLPIIIEIVNGVIADILKLVLIKLPEIVTAAVEALNDLIPKVKELISSILKMLEENSSEYAQKVVNIINNLLSTLGSEKNVDTIVKNVYTFVKNLLGAIIKNKSLLSEIFKSINKILDFLLDELTKNLISIAGKIAKVLLRLIAAAIDIVIASLGALAKLFLVFVSSILLIIGQTFAGLGTVIVEVAKVIVKSILRGIVDAIIWAQDAFAAIGTLIMQLIIRGLISIVKQGFGWLFDIIDKIFGTNIQEALNTASDFMAESMRSTIDKLDGSVQRVQNAIKKTSSNINDVINMAVEESSSAVNDGIQQIGDAVTAAQDTVGSKYKTLGKDAVSGYVEGINEGIEKVKDASADMAGDGADSTQKEQKSSSPSKVFAELGMWAALGYAKGIEENQQASSDVMTQMVTNAVTAAQDTIDSQNGDDLTIKVGMDISGVEEQSRNISSIMSGINNVTTTAYGRNANYTSNAMSRGSSNGSIINTDNSKAVTYNNVFNVTSTDPQKSADEIDRALSRQAMMAKLAHGGI